MVTVIGRIFLQSFFAFPNGFPNEGKAKIRIEEDCRESPLGSLRETFGLEITAPLKLCFYC
jgi:hypothetical protein